MGCHEDGTLDAASDCTIRLDGQVMLGEKVDVSLTVSCLMATYFVYSIAYPKQLKHTLLFIERFVCKLSVAGKLPVPVARVNALLS